MKKYSIFMTLVVLLLLCGSASAEGGISFKLTVNQESRTVACDILVDGDSGGTAATGLVKNGAGDIVYAAQGFTDENGKFSFSFINDDENGNYTLAVSAPRKGLKDSSDFKMITGGIKEIIKNTAKDAAGMKSIIENYGANMNLDMTAFNNLADKDAVYSFMANDSAVDLNNITSVTDGFYGAVIVCTIAQGGSGTDYTEFLNSETYGVLKISHSAVSDIFNKLTADVKNGVLTKVLEKRYTSSSELSPSLEFYILEQSLEKAVQWTEVNPVMKVYKDAGLLNVDFSDYARLVNPQLADEKMMNRAYSAYAEIVTTFNAAVAERLAAERIPSGSGTAGGGGSSGGGGGKGSGTVILPDKKPEPVEEINQPVKNTFTDMENHLWANEAVTYLVEQGIISGMGDGTFAPDNGLTREEFSTIIVKTQKLDTNGKTSSFNDVLNDRWSYPYVSAVFEAKLMVGISDDAFGATSKITRNEFAVIMKRLIDTYDADITENISLDEYDDAAEIPEWAKDSVKYMKATGLMLGITDNRFGGNETVSRAYACDILYNVLNAVNYVSGV